MAKRLLCVCGATWAPLRGAIKMSERRDASTTKWDKDETATGIIVVVAQKTEINGQATVFCILHFGPLNFCMTVVLDTYLDEYRHLFDFH